MSKNPDILKLLGKHMRLNKVPGILETMYPKNSGKIVPIIGVSDQLIGSKLNYFYYFEVTPGLFLETGTKIGWQPSVDVRYSLPETAGPYVRHETKYDGVQPGLEHIVWLPGYSMDNYTLYTIPDCVDIID